MSITKHVEVQVDVEQIDENEYCFEFDEIEDYEIILEVLRVWIQGNVKLNWFEYSGRFKLTLQINEEIKSFLESKKTFEGERGISWKFAFESLDKGLAFLPRPGGNS